MRLVLIGGGGHASEVLETFEDIADLTHEGNPVIGYVADYGDGFRLVTRGINLLGDIDSLGGLDATHYLLAVGWPKSRQILAARMPSHLQPFGVIHPEARLGRGVDVGAGTVIMAGAHVSPLSQVGLHVFLSYGVLIGHDCAIEDFVSVMPGAVVSGDTTLGEGCLVGTNATVIEGVTIGAGATLGAGAVAIGDVPPGVTAVGVPAVWK